MSWILDAQAISDSLLLWNGHVHSCEPSNNYTRDQASNAGCATKVEGRLSTKEISLGTSCRDVRVRGGAKYWSHTQLDLYIIANLRFWLPNFCSGVKKRVLRAFTVTLSKSLQQSCVKRQPALTRVRWCTATCVQTPLTGGIAHVFASLIFLHVSHSTKKN